MTGLDAHVVVSRPAFTLDARVQIAPGEVVAVMGPSGAGKSTLLGALAGLVPLADGRVVVEGRVLDSAQPPRVRVEPSRRRVVLLGQDARLFPHLDARSNIAFGLRARGQTRGEAAMLADEWLARVGLGNLGARHPSELSGGQQQRVALARALVTAPAVLLLDEPLTSLDPQTAGEVRATLHEQLAGTRTTAVVATHDAVDAVALADRLILLEAGRVTQTGDVRAVLAAPRTRFAAAVAGLNRVVGAVDGSAWCAGPMVLPVTSEGLRAGEAAALFRPSDVRIAPVGVEAVTDAVGWRARVVRLEPTPAGVRIRTTAPDVAVDVSADHAAGLTPGSEVTLQVDPLLVRFAPVDHVA